MQEYQEKYIRNARQIAELSLFFKGTEQSFGVWMEDQQQAERRMAELKEENMRLLSDGLFPVLDALHSASSETLEELSEFAGVLMDWKTNLDCGVYVVIHDALLSYYRLRKDRNNIIKELYMLGMGLYYSRRFPEGVGSQYVKDYAFRNEMVFTEAASYIRYFEDIEDDATRGYIIRSLHNITLCIKDIKRRIAANARALRTMTDPRYRELAPDLPWDRFVRASHQQMSINRRGLSRGELSKEDVAMVLDSCYEVFRPEEAAVQQNVRWLWPYYDMEFNCGYVDLDTTMDRMEELTLRTPADQYDMSGLYANVQLPLFYGEYMQAHPQLQTNEKRVRHLDAANRRMMQVLLSCPAEDLDDYFFYNVDIAISNFYELEGSLSYKEMVQRFTRRFTGSHYIRSRKAADLMLRFCCYIDDRDPLFFSDIPFLAACDPEKRRDALLAYAYDCGLFMDFGLIKMNMYRTMHTRELFEDEYEIYKLHTISGYDDLRRRKSTEVYADVALGHHSWYDGSGGYPSGYVRTDSPYRQMTDVAAVVSYMLSEWKGSMDGLIDDLNRCPKGQFSPIVLSQLSDEALTDSLCEVLSGSDEQYYREVYNELSAQQEDKD